MAVVRISERLKEAIVRNAENLFAPRIRAAMDLTPFVTARWPQRVYDKLLSEYLPHINKCPMEFFLWSSTVSINVYAEIDAHGRREIQISQPLPEAVFIPRELPPHSPATMVYGRFKLHMDSPAWADLKAELDPWAANCREINAAKTEFVKGVKQILESYTTLAPALKAWAPLWDLIPDETKAEHKRVVRRPKNDEVDLPANLDTLTSVMTANKILGGK